MLISAITKEEACSHLEFHVWYHDGEVLAGPISAVHTCRALILIKEIGPSLGLYVNVSKCELFSRSDLSLLPSGMKQSHNPNIEIFMQPLSPGSSLRPDSLKDLKRLVQWTIRLP